MSISAGFHKTEHASEEHPVLSIFGKSLDVWLGETANESDVLNLVPAQDWLADPDERALALSLLSDLEGRAIIPLLVCPDDMDLSCTVVVVEQLVANDLVHWHRFGYDLSRDCDQTGERVKWFESNTAIAFTRDEYSSAVQKFKELIQHA